MKTLAVLLLVFVAFTQAHASETSLSRIVGKLGVVIGSVLLNDHPVKSGTEVREGSTIEVKKGQATLLLGKGSVIHLNSDSKMVVSQFGVSPSTGEEGGNLDLKFGQTRALILNNGSEKKDIKIKARAATMGVRGTEIFISAPKDSSKPVEFYTLEGKAVVTAPGTTAVFPVNQNQGATATGGVNSAAVTVRAGAQFASPDQVRTLVITSGLVLPPVRTLQDANTPPAANSVPSLLPNQNSIGSGFLSDQFGAAPLPQVAFDPVSDTAKPLTVVPKFISVSGQ